ncbi:MAG: protoheme IX farnesyltransferase [Betaproteobacteria bacterium]|nr:protoheme IX farnesyltransferase [Betaproteobacteria bacterium]
MSEQSLTRTVLGLFKLRIGFVIMLTALVGYAVTPGLALSMPQFVVLGLSVLLSSASAGAFNQYVECDSDRLMLRTRKRAFPSGALRHTPVWLVPIVLLLVASVAAAWYVLNPLAALFVFLGAFFYAVVYTVWLKRRSWLNIVIGGLAGSFAVLAGAAAASPNPGMLPLLLALVLFLWTPPHFWSLAIANHADYTAANIPMLPVVVGDARAAQIVCASTVLLVGVSLLPIFFGAGPIYLLGALGGGGYFIYRTWQLARRPGRTTALAAFFASFMQLSLLLAAAVLEVLINAQ